MVVEVQGYSQSKSQSKQRELVLVVEDSVKPVKVGEVEISAHVDFEVVIQGLDEEIHGVKGNQNLSKTVLRKDIATDGGEQLVKVAENVAITKVVHGVDRDEPMESQQYHAMVGLVDMVFNPGWTDKTGGKKSIKEM